jgi:hypothetical protein
MISRLLLFFFALGCSSLAFAQTDSGNTSITLHKGHKKFTLNKYDRIFITQESLNTDEPYSLRIKSDSLVFLGDSLLVRPWYVWQKKYIKGKRSKTFNWPNTPYLKIPTHDIKKISIKRQPICFFLSAIATISYIGAFTAIFAIPPNSEANIDKRTNITLSFMRVFIPSFAARLIVGKKHLHLKKSTIRSRPWQFENTKTNPKVQM